MSISSKGLAEIFILRRTGFYYKIEKRIGECAVTKEEDTDDISRRF